MRAWHSLKVVNFERREMELYSKWSNSGQARRANSRLGASQSLSVAGALSISPACAHTEAISSQNDPLTHHLYNPTFCTDAT